MTTVQSLPLRPVAFVNTAGSSLKPQSGRKIRSHKSSNLHVVCLKTIGSKQSSTRLHSLKAHKHPWSLLQTSRLSGSSVRQWQARTISVSSAVSVDTSAEAAYHVLPSGERLEVLERKAKSSTGAPLVFVHGAHHAAWCWEEHWMEYFAERGHDTYAVSLLGQGNSSVVDGPTAGGIFSHAATVADIIMTRVNTGAVLVGHSFGGLVVQAYIAKTTSNDPAFPPLAAAVLVCSAPPVGFSEMVKRMGLSMVKRITSRNPIAAVKMTWRLFNNGVVKNASLCKESFFSPDMPDADVSRYQKRLEVSSKQPVIDQNAMKREIPVTRPREGNPPVLVLAAEKDVVADKVGQEETAAFFWTEAVVVPNIAHDVMLDVRWKDAADRLLDWLSENRLSKLPS